MFASERLRCDRGVVCAACESNGTALSFVTDDELRSDPDVVLRAVHQRGDALMFAAEHGWFLARQFENDANPAAHLILRHCAVYTARKCTGFVTSATSTTSGAYEMQ